MTDPPTPRGPAASARDRLGQARQRCQDRRAAVLACPDLAEALTQPPLCYARPECWNGYIPPPYLPEQSDPWYRDGPGPVTANDSGRRADLLVICAEAEQRGR